MTGGDLAYLLARLCLAAYSGLAAVATLRFALAGTPRPRNWRLGVAGGVLLCIAACMSVQDAVFNIVLRPHEPVQPESWLWLFCFDMLLPVWALVLVRAWREREQAEAELARLAATDPLTGALNRRGFLEGAAAAIAQARRARQPIAVMMLDLDRFKAINDGHGHGAGDTVLRGFVAALAPGLRAGDVVGRLGGEEFAVLLPDNTAAQGVATADRLRAQVRRTVPHPAGAAAAVTFSAGVAAVSAPGEPRVALSTALAEADRALYQAKQGGRDRVVPGDLRPASGTVTVVHPLADHAAA
jgi:diguanylate cyclase (GGDEF)-like protein